MSPSAADGREVAVPYEVVVRNLPGQVTALGSGGPFTVVVDRPVEVGGGGLGFNGGELLHLAVAGCVSNDLFREAAARGIRLERVEVTAEGDFTGSPAVSAGIRYAVTVHGDAAEERLVELVELVDRLAEIPESLRRGTSVTLVGVSAGTTGVPSSAQDG